MLKRSIKYSAKQTYQLNLEHVLNGKMPDKKRGWVKVKFTDLDRQQIADVIGGRRKQLIAHNLEQLPYWFKTRLIYSLSARKWVYVAGQDSTWERNSARQELYKRI